MPSMVWWTPSLFQAAIAQDLPTLHPGEDVLDTGSHLLVRVVVLLLPGGQFLVLAFAVVRDDQAGAAVAAVGDRCGLPNCRFGVGFRPRSAVAAVTGQRTADHDDEAGVGVDDDLVADGLPVILGLFGHRVVPRGYQGAVCDQHGVLAESLARLECEHGAEVSDDAVGRRLRHPEQRGQLPQRQVRPPPHRTSSAPSRRSAVTSLPKQRGLSPVNGLSRTAPTP